ncbi:hypothetical protein BUQ74_12405 [Leptospira weilii serovar Heyan]|uniref:hypothetical protein n=1 Tax=Leptospira weilii TaxID=28184 RepID=UPI00038178A7|nr:hypothetical protein [Leptospira weilii]OMI16994.1 hypothetical protein BUQ74_12405 [Leptospira weilii serovar Heyan]ULH27417.1 hypothetical protein FH586_13440 [Leptospira weilii]
MDVSEFGKITGCDTIRVFLHENNLFRYADCKLKKRKNERDEVVEKLVFQSIYIRRLKYKDNFLPFYSIQFSISTLFEELNLSSKAIDYNALINALTKILLTKGLEIINWNKVALSRLDINRDLVTEIPFENLRSILEILKFPRRNKIRKHESLYFENKSYQFCIYDKGKELLETRGIRCSKNLIRFECRALRTTRVKTTFKKFHELPTIQSDGNPYLYLLESFDMDHYFIEQSKILLDPIINFKHQLESNNLSNELLNYYDRLKKQNASKLTDVSLLILEAKDQGRLDEFVSQNSDLIMRRSKRSNSALSRKRAIVKKTDDLLFVATMIREIISHGYRHINELKSAMLDERPKPIIDERIAM